MSDAKFGATAHVEVTLGSKKLDDTMMRYATKLEISEARDMMDQLVLSFSFPQVPALYDLNDLAEPGAEYKVKITTLGAESMEYEGYIQSVKRTKGRTGGFTIEITGLDALIRLKRNRPPKTWATLKEAIETMASEIDFKAKIQGYNATETPLNQEDDDDLTFLTKYAKQKGFILRASNKTLFFTSRDLPDAPDQVKLTWQKDIISMNLTADISEVFTEVVVASHNYVQDKAIVAKSTDSDIKGISSSKSIATSFASKCFGKRTMILNNDADSDTSAMKDTAKAKMNGASDKFVTGDITCIGHPEIVAGTVVEITDGTWPLSGKYLVSKATHSITPGVGFRTKLTINSNSLPDKK